MASVIKGDGLNPIIKVGFLKLEDNFINISSKIFTLSFVGR
jgi:hypothetical protein